MNRKNFESEKTNQLANLIIFLGISVFLTLLVRTAWQADDAYTAWRLVDNFVNGYGLRNNIDERVQTFTSTLWTMLNASVFFFTRNIYYTSVGLSILCSLLAVWVSALPYRKSPSQLFFLFGSVTLSIAFMDFSVGGFENPLGHLIFATFVYFYFFKFEDEITPRRFTLLFFIAGLAALNRLDTPAFYIFPLILLFKNYKAPLRKKVGYVLLGLSPLILWHLFALIYFGFPLQNAAYAKRFNGIPTSEFLRAGIDYYINSFSRDPITLVTAAGALVVSLRSRDLKLRYLGYGIVFYMMYVLYIGGGYMSGRFFTMIFFVSILAILRSRVLEDIKFARVALPAMVLLGCLGVNPTFTTRKDYGAEPGLGITSEWIDKGIADERDSWYQNSGFLFASRFVDMPKPGDWWDHKQAVKSFLASVGNGPCVGILTPAGYASYYLPRTCHIYDLNGQVDPLMARIPNRYRKIWRQAHLFKPEIPGYRETLIGGNNVIEDPDIALYYDKIRLITRGDIWSWERFKTIAKMNLGHYDYLLKAYADRNGISWGKNWLNKFPPGAYVKPFYLYGDNIAIQRFRIQKPNLAAILITTVTGGDTQVNYPVTWRLVEIRDNKKIPVVEGVFDSENVFDWKQLRLELPLSLESAGRTYELMFMAESKLDADHAIGLPLYTMSGITNDIKPIVVPNSKANEGLNIGINFEYRD